MAELPRWVSTRAQELKVQKPARLELRRSLEMHRWPALGVTLAGVVLAAIYLVTLWPSETSSTQLAGVIVCATGILTISIVLGASVAIVAHNSDQRIYIGADIENLLGVSPLVQLPDLSEASTEAAQQKLICLAKGIAEVCTEGSVRRCVFTGTGVGAGVSTVAAKTKETLREIGRAALLVDAAWATPGAGPGIGNTQDEGASESNGLILTDTAPLAESPDTEFLTRFADCVIVVVESGVTTREQLRNTANCLQRLNVAAVGFVLNRVRQARSGLTLRYLLRTGKSNVPRESVGVRKEFKSAVQRALADAPQETLPAHPRSAASLMGEPEKPWPTTELNVVKHPPQRSASPAQGTSEWLTEAQGRLEEGAPQQEIESGKMLASQLLPSQLRPAKERVEFEVRDPGQSQEVTIEAHSSGNASQAQESGAMLFGVGWQGPANVIDSEPKTIQSGRLPAAVETPQRKPSRLSALRGLVTPESLRDLREAKERDGENGRAAQTDSAPTLVDFRREIPERLSGLRGIVMPAHLKEAPGTQAAIPSSEQEKSANGSEHASEKMPKLKANPEEGSSKPPSSEPRVKRPDYDDVQILPSKRGQYRRRK
ncbi:MAG: hypothetical protein WBA18_17750 [Terracidiphilus sp.]